MGDVDGDGQADALVGAPFAWAGEQYAGFACVVLGPITADVELATGAHCIEGEGSRVYMGAALAVVGDINGDGVPETAVAAPESYRVNTSGKGRGSIYLFTDLSAAGSTADAVAAWTGEGEEDAAGSALASGGDLTGDGLPDLVVGAGGWNSDAGAVYILGSGALGGGDLEGADARYYSLDGAAGDYFGSSVAMLGDIDGDGIGDLGVGWGHHDGGDGAVVVYLGPLNGAHAAADWDGFVSGDGGSLGMYSNTLIGAGDVDGDGTPDILVGTPDDYRDSLQAGKAWLISGAAALAGTDVVLAMATFEGHRFGQGLGWAVASIGDQDGDGFADVLIGSPGDDLEGESGGSASLFYGPVRGTHTREDADAVWGGVARSSAGSALAGGMDLTGDGYSDLLIAAEAASTGGNSSGVVYLVPGMMP
jgi:hypothetical protein